MKPDAVDRLMKVENLKVSMSISFGGFNRDTFDKVMGVDRFETFSKNIHTAHNATPMTT